MYLFSNRYTCSYTFFVNFQIRRWRTKKALTLQNLSEFFGRQHINRPFEVCLLPVLPLFALRKNNGKGR
jgi:hypothetical protein